MACLCPGSQSEGWRSCRARRYLLTQYPEVEAKLLAELDAAELLVTPQRPRPRDMEYSDLGRLTYLSWVCKVRALRQRPPTGARRLRFRVPVLSPGGMPGLMRRLGKHAVWFPSSRNPPKGHILPASSAALCVAKAEGLSSPLARAPCLVLAVLLIHKKTLCIYRLVFSGNRVYSPDNHILSCRPHQEAMRHMPVASTGVTRTTKRDMRLGEHFVPEGTTVIVPFDAVHHYHGNWADPDSFLPVGAPFRRQPLVCYTSHICSPHLGRHPAPSALCMLGVPCLRGRGARLHACFVGEGPAV